MDILTNPVVVALFALLAIPAVTSGVAGLLKNLEAATGIGSRVWVYVASLIVTGLVLATSGVNLPTWTDDPALYAGAWIAWLGANAEITRRLYEALYERAKPI